jgi:hypothetical protein
MEYNSQRDQLIIPEYGRNIQNMVGFCVGVEDREERNKVAQAIISVMGQLFPYLRDIEDYNHKLWDHLHIMADFKLDVDSPYPIPAPEELRARPEMVNYPTGNFKYSHYGKTLQEFINKAKEYPEGDERDTLTLIIANLMKKHYLTWNRDTVEDEVILRQLNELSEGVLKLKEGQELVATQDVVIVPRQPLTPTHGKKKKPMMKKKKRG